jgi:hypothetical protein
MNITEKQIYDDNLFDQLFIGLFSRKMAKALGKTTKFQGYDGFVDLSQQIMAGRNPKQQQEIVGIVLKSLVPSPVLYLIRTFFSPTKWVCESNAWFASILFEWLVGYCDVKEVEVLDENQQLRSQKSCLHIRKCRYLEQSGCVGMCINMCKLPTQDFFTNSFGIPVTMTPNFEDLSCEMVFGKVAPPIQQDPAYNQECLLNHCPTAKSNLESCPKLKG